MNACLYPRNGVSLSNNIDVPAHSISVFQDNEQPKKIKNMLIPKTDISIAEPTDVQIYELANFTTQMYQIMCIINDEKMWP